MYMSAPTSCPRWRSNSWPLAVTERCGYVFRPSSFFTALQTSKPFFLGIMTSRKTRFGSSLANGLQRFFAVGGSEEVHTLVFQFLESLLDQRAQMRLVVNDKNFHRASWIDQEENVLHSFLKAQGAHCFVTGEKRIEDDDVGLGMNGPRNKVGTVGLRRPGSRVFREHR